MDVGATGSWLVDSGHNIHHLVNDGTDNEPISGQALDIGVSDDGITVFAIGTGSLFLDQDLWRFVGGSAVWEQVHDQTGVRVDAAGDGSAFMTTSSGQVFHISGSDTTPTRTQIGQASIFALDVSVGGDNTVFIVGYDKTAAHPGPDYPIYVLDPSTNTFDPIPGAAGIHVSAGNAQNVSVVNAEGGLWTTMTVASGGACHTPACECTGVWTGKVCEHICPCGGAYPSHCLICQ
jgi:hypothetical protein